MGVVQPEANQTMQITREPGRALDLDLDLDVDGEGDGGELDGTCRDDPLGRRRCERVCTSKAVSSHATVLRLARAAADGGGGVSVEQPRPVDGRSPSTGDQSQDGEVSSKEQKTSGGLVGGGA